MLRFVVQSLLSGLLLPLSLSVAFAQSDLPPTPREEILVMQRIGGPVTIDGPSFEPAWQTVEPYIPSQYEPNNGAPATERTEFRIAYND